MTLLEAVSVRRSQRTYLPRPLERDQLDRLGKALAECNRRAGLNLRLICDRSEPFSSFSKGAVSIKGVRDYLLFAGPSGDPDLEEKCGYYGEEIILTAEAMGLSTCWVGGTYDRKRCLPLLEQGEELVCVAAIGAAANGAARKNSSPHRAPEELADAVTS